jgi:PAS domain S-box-containing protein
MYKRGRDIRALILIAAIHIFLPQQSPASIKESSGFISDLCALHLPPDIGPLDEAIASRLEKAPSQVALYRENPDPPLLPDDASQSRFHRSHHRTYRDWKRDVISMALYREPAVQELYQSYILGGIFLILSEALTLALLWQYRRRKMAETELATTHDRLGHPGEASKPSGVRERFYRAKNSTLSVFADITERQQLEEKLRISQEMLASAVGTAMDAILAVDSEQQIVLFNSAAEKIFGCRAEEAIGTPFERFVPHRFRSSHKAHIHRFCETGISNRAMGTLGTCWGLRASGEEFPIEASISQAGSAGNKFLTFVIRDVTERRRAEQTIHESEERFRLVANTAPVLIWMSGTDKLCTYFNQPWLQFTGRSMEAELGNGWTDNVHPEDLSVCLNTYTNAFDQRESFKMQYRLRRNDGEYRWFFDLGVPRFNPDGSFAGYIGSCVDVTERKIAEEALARLSGRLIEAQEEECRRIARDIHDDYNQRLAMVANELEDLAQSIGDSVAEAAPRLRKLWNSVSELGVDLHSLSHRLHSSTLETLGLVAGVRAFCEEFEEMQELQIGFTHLNVPRVISADISLCLFRVVQESLRNIKRHSGAITAQVHLEFRDQELHLSVSDRGKGFNPGKRSARDGIGIRSMEERLRFFGGRLEVHSQPMEGTTVEAWVPSRRFT